MEELDEVILSKERKFDGVVIDVEHWKVRLPDGSEGLREIVLHKGAAAVIPVDEQGRVAMAPVPHAAGARNAGDSRRQAGFPGRRPAGMCQARAARGNRPEGGRVAQTRRAAHDARLL